MVLLRCNIFRASYVHLIKDTDTGSMYCRDMQVRFLKVKTLLNNAFKIPFILFTAFRSKIQRGGGGGEGPHIQLRVVFTCTSYQFSSFFPFGKAEKPKMRGVGTGGENS